MATGSRAGGLDLYRAKRDFKATPEPQGKRAGRRDRRFVIQMHDARRLHYDLRLALDGVLKSWAVTRGPSLDPAAKRLAVRTEDHPMDYAEFEGVIPKGAYGAGTVMLWDQGSWRPLHDPDAGLADGKLVFELDGQRLKGTWALVRMRPKAKEKRENWLLIKQDDEAADPKRDITAEATTSITTGRTLEEIADEDADPPAEPAPASGSAKGANSARRPTKVPALPRFVAPALATLSESLPEGEGWLFEPKFDGYRIQAACSGEAVRLHTRNRHDWSDRFGRIVGALGALDLDRALIDGEVVVIDESGRSDFGALQRLLEEGGSGRVAYFAFDLLTLGGASLRSRPLIERKAALKEALSGIGRRGPIHFTDHVSGDGGALARALEEAGFEGVIAKRAGAPYHSGRRRDWLKVKFARHDDFVIVGWSPSSAAGRPFSSILLGTPGPDGLVYAGRVGSGFGAKELASLSRRFEPLARTTAPLEGPVPKDVARDARWVEPELVAEIAFAERTASGAVRHGRYLGLRPNKAGARAGEAGGPVEIVAQGKVGAMAKGKAKTSGDEAGDEATGEVVVAGVRLSNPDRVLFPAQGLTKQDLARYLEAMAPRMLPYLESRLVSLVRCPEGRAKKCFFQRHEGAGIGAGFKQLEVAHKRGDRAAYLYLDDVATLVATAQMGVLELHIWGSKVDAIEKPDRLVFDLDPDPEIGFERVREAAFGLRDALGALGLESFALLTGGKGVHVVVPLTRRHDWPTVKAFGRALAERFVEAEPETYVATMSKARRRGRIFIDHFRNDRGSTAIAPYSARARPGAPVAWPVSWEELADVRSAAAVDIPAALARAQEADGWRGYGELRQSLTQGARRALGV